jgi:predicted RNA methylase
MFGIPHCTRMSAADVRSVGLDKFYTIPTIAKSCLNIVGARYSWSDWDLVVEPSAGNGSFLTQIPVPTAKRVGIDIAPEHPDILRGDFLMYEPVAVAVAAAAAPPPQPQRILVVGNPPFGRVSSLAIKFFNHAAKWAQVIAFIVPRTFRRVSVQNKLSRDFQLVHDMEIPTEPCAFNPPMMAKCCFQIWERTGGQRPIVELPTTHPDWTFLAMGPKDARGQPTPPVGADFAIRAYGGKCGEIVCDGLDALRPKSWHWIVAKADKHVLVSRFRELDYSVSTDTARQNSIGRGELVRLYSEAFD